MDKFQTQLDSYLAQSKNANVKLDYVAYGTAGFRGRSDKIAHLFSNVGLISGLRSLIEGANIGIMITASHNPIDDNGVKLIDPNGEMLASDWEHIVEEFSNLPDRSELVSSRLKQLIDKYKIDLSKASKHPAVLVGYDTRPSSKPLVDLLIEGLQVWAPFIRIINYNLVTTPALHYLVAESNKLDCILDLHDYYDKLINGTDEFFNSSRSTKRQYYKQNELIIDCANGVGIKTMDYLCSSAVFKEILPVKLLNRGEGILNHNCGADFVKTRHIPSEGANKSGIRYAALDGDADRIIYFYLEDELGAQKLRLLDGDKIMALYALFLKDSLKRAELDDRLTLGIIQTAYANGASTDYIKQQLGLSVDCVDTGVKNLHKKALDYDFAVYFEANGHGTIWVSERAKVAINGAESSAGLQLRQLLNMLNNYTGDAISDILIVEAILYYYDMNIESWFKFYDDRPNSLIKVEVRDRTTVKTTNAGRTCLEPIGLQEQIDLLVGKFSSQARCFVRASGTENVVRVYAEAKSQSESDELAKLVGQKVIQMCDL